MPTGGASPTPIKTTANGAGFKSIDYGTSSIINVIKTGAGTKNGWGYTTTLDPMLHSFVDTLPSGAGFRRSLGGSNSFLESYSLGYTGRKQAVGGEAVALNIFVSRGKGHKAHTAGSNSIVMQTALGLTRPVLNTTLNLIAGMQAPVTGGHSRPLVAYQNLGQRINFRLLQRDTITGNIIPVESYSISKAVLTLTGPGHFCIDSSVERDPIALLEKTTVVQFQIGKIAGLLPGQYKGWLTIYDWLSSEGIPWSPGGDRQDKPTFDIQVIEWPICN